MPGWVLRGLLRWTCEIQITRYAYTHTHTHTHRNTEAEHLLAEKAKRKRIDEGQFG